MSNTQIRAEQLAAQRRERKRYVSVEVHVSTYETVDVPLHKIDTQALVNELTSRQRNGSANYTSDGDLEEGYAMFTLDVSELWAIRHLYLTGREVEASDRSKRLLADMLGTAI